MRTEFEEGWDAGCCGQPSTSCPYNGKHETQERADWIDGWEAATKEPEEEE